MKRARILLADDHTLVLEGVAKLLEPEFEIVASVTDGPALFQAANDLNPDLVLMEVSLPSLNALEAGSKLLKNLPNLKLIFLTANEDLDIVAEAIQIGAKGYILKTCTGAELVDAIQLILRGSTYLTPTIRRKIEPFFENSPYQKSPTSLTLRQREVLHLLAKGQSMKEVAFALRIAPRTVAYHKYRMMEDFHLHSNAALVKFAVRRQVA